MPQKICPVCNNEFSIPNAWLKKLKGVPCCSRICRAKYQEKPKVKKARVYIRLEVLCATCGKQIEMIPSRATRNKTHYCNKACMDKRSKKSEQIILKYRKGAKPIVNCSYCNSEISIYPSKLKHNKNFYCSKTCRAKHIRGANNPSFVHGEGRHIYYGLNWKSQRRKILELDGYKCQYCGKSPDNKKSLHVHHITKAAFFENREDANNIQNLITLCDPCHKKAEKGIIKVQRRLF